MSRGPALLVDLLLFFPSPWDVPISQANSYLFKVSPCFVCKSEIKVGSYRYHCYEDICQRCDICSACYDKNGHEHRVYKERGTSTSLVDYRIKHLCSCFFTSYFQLVSALFLITFHFLFSLSSRRYVMATQGQFSSTILDVSLRLPLILLSIYIHLSFFRNAFTYFSKRPCLGQRFKQPDGSVGPYTWITYGELHKRVLNFGSGLRELLPARYLISSPISSCLVPVLMLALVLVPVPSLTFSPLSHLLALLLVSVR
jgi:hypothetical protein